MLQSVVIDIENDGEQQVELAYYQQADLPMLERQQG
ncbi:Uncharacterised protein [Serratia fonticola]|uniref:Uncharacterized protein n=1 Tax=Serratia fonticola TaxID=47917 RepID=A0A4U9TU99_SERFO|nr:Uncharacterised protein [Serratia fonticola]